MAEGLVLWGVKSIYTIMDLHDKQEYECRIKGKILSSDFNVKGRRETNPIVVGDQVEYEKIAAQKGLILSRKPRKNEFKRLKKAGRQVQTLIANIDLLIVVDSVDQPRLNPFFIDRCLFTADFMQIPAMIVFNKIDLLKDAAKADYDLVKSSYLKLDYPILETSALKNSGLSELKKILKNKITSLNGRSGVGKSALIKAIDSQYSNIKIGAISQRYQKGMHTTTFARIYPLKIGGNIADTPGIRELAIYINSRQDLERNFRDFNGIREQCKFSNCQHIDEPHCQVRQAVEQGLIASFRYASYLKIRQTIEKMNDSSL